MNKFRVWYKQNVDAHPRIPEGQYKKNVVVLKEVKATTHGVPKVEVAGVKQAENAVEYSVYSWIRWDKKASKLPKHFVFRLTVNKNNGDASNLGDRTLMLTMNDDDEFVFSTYNFKFNVGKDRIDRVQKMDSENNLGEWCWVYFGFKRSERKATAYMRWKDLATTKFFEDEQHFLPAYFGLYLGNERDSKKVKQNGWNGWMKHSFLCIGKDQNCYRENNFEELNCAEKISDNPEGDTVLGKGKPGCLTPVTKCKTGLPEPCEKEKEYQGSAKVEVDWPEVKVTDLIPQPYDKDLPTHQVEVPESYMPYITEYSYGFWYQFRFRSPIRMEVQEKRSNTHAVAGVTEKDTYCKKGSLGDRALSIFFEEWSKTKKPTYNSCTYDSEDNSPNRCKDIEFEYTAVDGYWYYVYNGYSSKENKVYTVFKNDEIYKEVSFPGIQHNHPPASLKFQLGATTGFDAVNGYFYHV